MEPLYSPPPPPPPECSAIEEAVLKRSMTLSDLKTRLTVIRDEMVEIRSNIPPDGLSVFCSAVEDLIESNAVALGLGPLVP